MSIFKENHNCWKQSTARYAAPLIDCENYYRALYESICKAKKSIYIVGWDIDSRIKLIRGKEADNLKYSPIISELIAQRTTENPELEVYLLRWDSSLAFFSMREIWAKEVWDNQTPSNVYCCLDSTIPMGGSQHQKIVVVDNDIAFSGGMDVAVNRWDTREHLPVEPNRNDPDGEYGPFHDVHSVVSGPIVNEFIEAVRWRWDRVCKDKRLPEADSECSINNDQNSEALPACWPDSVEPFFENITCAIARTVPFMDDVEPVQEVRYMLLGLIEQARDFIYIENQFLTREEIAEALNKQLKACPSLNVLIVSSYSPKSTVECEAYWSSRIDFKDILENGVDKNRVRMVCSLLKNEDGEFAHKRFHSKVMVIDDAYAVIGSSNITNRSMALDTECDLVFHAENSQQKAKIAEFRNDLIGEHCSQTITQVDQHIRSEGRLDKLLSRENKTHYYLSEVADHRFTDRSFEPVIKAISDPEESIVSPLSFITNKRSYLSNPSKKVLVVSTIIIALMLLALGGYLASRYIPWFTPDNLQALLESTRGTYWALPLVCLVYVIAGLLFFPVTVLSLAVAAVFGPLWGPIYGMCGAVISSLVTFGVGATVGGDSLSKYGGKKVKAVDERLRQSGIIGVAAIRLIPIAPFSLVNLVAGISSIKLYQFLVGTFLGMFPPMIAKGLVGDSLAQIISKPSITNVSYLVGGIVAWIIMIYLSQKLVNIYQRSREKKVQESSNRVNNDNNQNSKLQHS